MTTILIGLEPEALSAAERERIQALAPQARLLVSQDRAEIEAALDDIEIVLRDMPRDLIARAPKLRWMQQWGAGADWLQNHPEVVEKAFILTNASGVHAIPISEHIFAFLLAFARGFHRAGRAQQERGWAKETPETIFELAGRTMLLIGVGAIGARTARIAAALDMIVIGVRRDPTKMEVGISQMVGPDQLTEVLPRADIVVLTVPLTPETRHLIGEAELQQMKAGAYIVNIGRGGTIDEAALVSALQSGRLAGAGLDVFETEPLPPDSPLWAMDNVIVTAHYSGLTPFYQQRVLDIFTDNLRRYLAGEPLRNVVDKRLGY